MPNQTSFFALNLVRQAVVTLTDAQIKKLHTTPVVLVEAPGPDRFIQVTTCLLVAHFPTPYAAFTPNYQSLMLAHGTGSSGGITAQLFNTGPGGDTYLNAVLTNANSATDHLTKLPAPSFTYSTDWGEIAPTSHARGLVDWVNKPLRFFLDASGGAITGGSSANTLTVAVLYTVFDVSTRQFI